MKTLIYPFAGYLLLLTTIGCSLHSHSHRGHEAHSSSPSSSQDHGLVLNGTRKWKTDEHTSAVFSLMSARVFEQDLKSQSGDDLKELGISLRQDIDDLIAGCTMEGDAHNELHKFLVLYIPEVEQLRKLGDLDNANNVGELLEVYLQYFD
jgi:hypothetical protein